MLISPNLSVTLHRRTTGGGFEIDRYEELDANILLPAIDKTLPLVGLYELLEF